MGMAGNVSEWVNTWTPDNRFPVVKGGNYLSADVRLDKRSTEYGPARAEEHIGFRTVSSKAFQSTQ
jgi:formylglycine-generating enzyme required for sulfatase activity